MKKMFKRMVMVGAVMALGLTVGFAASTAIQNLDGVKQDIETLLGINRTDKAYIESLTVEIVGLASQIADLKAEEVVNKDLITDLENQLESAVAQRDEALGDNLDLEARIQALKDFSGSAVLEAASE